MSEQPDHKPARRGRSGGRSGNSRRSVKQAIEQLHWHIPHNPDRFTDPLDEDGVAAIHDAAMRVLEEIGIEFLNEEAKNYLREAGCDVDPNSDNVKFDRAWIMEMLAHAPSEFTITPRNRDREITLGGRNMIFGQVSSPPNAICMDHGRRVGNTQDFENLVRLSQYFNCIHFVGGYPVEPVDIHASVRHLDCSYTKIKLTDKALHAYSLGKERVEDVMEMVKISSQLSDAEFESKAHMFTNINSSSPLKHDFPMLDGAMRCARRNQSVTVTPFTLAGAMAPVTMPGAVVLFLAEGLAAIALMQYIRPGVGCVLGSFTSNVDMKSGAPAFGTPEYMRATQISGQMARYYGLPLRASNACAANAPDGQAMWESANSVWSAVMGGVNVLYHGAGWLEGGLIASFEKFIMDCELLQQVQRYFDPVLWSTKPEDLAVEAIADVGPTGHYFGNQHTQERYTTAFYAPFLSDWRNFESWSADGSIWTAERANKIWKKILAEFEPPPLDEAIDEELQAFVAKRKEEGGAPTDF